MTFRLFSIEHMPRDLPIWDAILDDLGRPPPERIAKALGVGRSTAYRWQNAHSAPRAAALALFWLTRWGRSQIDAQATNDAVLAVSYARALAEERLQLLDRVRQLEELASRLAIAAAQPQAAPAHGNGATADRFRTGTSIEARQVEPAAPSLGWPPLMLPLPEIVPPMLPARPAPGRAADRQGSPAAQRPEAHSSTDPGAARTPRPRPSTRRGA